MRIVVPWQWRRGPATLTRADRLATWPRFHQLPEPWNGHLARARLLFVSSNPSIGGTIPPNPQTAPPKPHLIHGRVERRRDRRAARNAFSHYMDDGVRPKGGEAVPFWAAIKARATELFQRPVAPGDDYAITEAVRCKSEDEQGVREALATCSRRYLRRTLDLSAARVVVGVGAHARAALADVLRLPSTARLQLVPLDGREILVTFLPHPAAYVRKTFATTHTDDELRRLREALAV